ncbi:MAG: DsbA family oxidoreductase [Muribaculaceae bacterium]|nr:DsbA family oxidoreductase [Muribaculaceae bacterium]MDE6553638.1 DsbA family oxidoreductase [Muribaculaceae bacterium]
MEIKIWADFACPYSYMGEKQLMDIIEKQGITDKVKIRFLSYQLDPNAPAVPVETMTQHFMDGHKFTAEETAHLMERITKMASRVGLDYKLATTQVCSTFDAHRLMEYAQATCTQETAIKLNFALFHANFIENLRLSDHSVLLSIAENCGLDSAAVRTVLESDEYGEQVKAEEKEVDARPDFDLIPYMVFDDTTVLQGVISPGAMKKALAGEGED